MRTTARRPVLAGYATGLALFALIVATGGCQTAQVREQTDKNVRTASANLHAVGDHLEGAPATNPEGRAVNAETDIIDDALSIPKDNRKMATVPQAQWDQVNSDLRAKSTLADGLEKQRDELTGQLAAARSESSWWRVATGSAAGGVVALLLGGVASAFGVPWVSSIGQLVCAKGIARLKGQVTTLTEQNSTAMTAVAASDVAREALAHLDAKLAKQPAAAGALGNLVSGITGGQADTLEDYFKVFAKAHAVDEGASQAVDTLLGQVRDTVDSRGGRSASFLNALDALGKAAVAVESAPAPA